MTGIVLRQFSFPEDYAAVFSLWQGAGAGIGLGPSDQPAEIEKKFRRDPDLFLVAEADGRLVGSVIGGFDGRRGMIYHLAVAAEYRRQGLAGRLMDEVEQRLRQKGCRKAYLLVKKGNDPAKAFYADRGWAGMETIELFGKTLD
jgi:ribosomal protein S18 acetylase RimI-like enzyme